jgi:hypothetical protein
VIFFKIPVMPERHHVLFYGEFLFHKTKLDDLNLLKPIDEFWTERRMVSKSGMDSFSSFFEHAEKCYNERNGACVGETGTLYPEPFTIVPFRLVPDDQCVLTNMQDVLLANERFVQAEEIEFPLISLRVATDLSYERMGTDLESATFAQELGFKSKWCCHGHYYLTMLVKALYSMGYCCDDAPLQDKVAFLPSKAVFRKIDGTSVIILAEAGM